MGDSPGFLPCLDNEMLLDILDILHVSNTYLAELPKLLLVTTYMENTLSHLKQLCLF